MSRRAGSRSPLAYRPPSGRSPAFLQRAGAPPALAYLGSLTLVAFAYSSPLMLIAAGAAVGVAGLVSGARVALASTLKYAISLAVLMVAVNVLVSERGSTVLVRGLDVPVLGSVDVTLESIAAGGTIALRVVVVAAAFAVMSACVDPDELLRLIRPLARRSALTATLIGRLVPLAAADHARLAEAARLRGPGAAPASRAALARRLVAGALDRSLDAAATLELRGYALPPARSPGPRRRGRAPGALYAAAAAIVIAAVAGAAAGLCGFSAYPEIAMDAGAADLALALAIPAVAAVPVALAYRRRAGARRAAERVVPREVAIGARGAGGG